MALLAACQPDPGTKQADMERLQQQILAKQDLLIVDELGYVPLSKTGAELLFEIFSQRYEQGSTLPQYLLVPPAVE